MAFAVILFDTFNIPLIFNVMVHNEMQECLLRDPLAYLTRWMHLVLESLCDMTLSW